MTRDPVLLHAVGMLLLAAIAIAAILRWDNKRYEEERRRWRDRFKKK